MHDSYIKPQESGMRYSTYWAELTDENGFGLRFESNNSFVFNANHYNVAQCAKAAHAEDLKEYDTTVVHLDGFMMGAGSNACGPVPDAEHRMPKVPLSSWQISIVLSLQFIPVPRALRNASFAAKIPAKVSLLFE